MPEKPPAAPPPEGALLQMITGKWVTKAIGVVARYDIATMLKDGPRNCHELAIQADVHPSALYRVLRALASIGVFTETEPRHFALTPIGELLRSDRPDSMRDFAIMVNDDWHWQTWGAFDEVVRTGETAVSGVLGYDNIFDFFADEREPGERFDAAMTSLTAALVAAVSKAYDFSGIKRIVDIGGGHGGLLTAILNSHPDLHGVVFDLPHVVAGAHEALAKAGLAARCDAVGGDFFESVPGGADAYIMSHIIHDWDDERSITILSNIHHAMEPGGRVLVVDCVIPLGNEPHPGKWLDLEMLTLPGGMERTEAEFRSLFEAAGFHLERIVPTESPECIVEGKRI